MAKKHANNKPADENGGSVSDELLIKFEGLEADKNQLPLDDFLSSMTGWRNFLNATSSVFLQKKLSWMQPSEGERLNIKIREIRPGSLEAVFWVSLAGAAIGNFLTNKADKIVTINSFKLLGKWINDSFNFHVKEKKELHNKEEIVAALEKMFIKNGISVEKDKPDSHRYLEYIDDSLKQASEPIEKSANNIIISSKTIHLNVDIVARRAIKNGFLPNSRSADFFGATVRVRELNLDTGHTRLEVLKSINKEFGSKMDMCYIEDPNLEAAGNPYSKSLDTQSPIDVFVSQVVDKGTGNTIKWKIRRDIPRQKAPLFEHDSS